MALFDCVLENSVLTEGALSASSMKVQLTSILLKIAGGNTDMASAKDIERAIGKVKGVRNVKWLLSISGDMGNTTYYQHRYIIEDKKDIMYQVDVWNKPLSVISKITLRKLYDPSNTNIPKEICEDFITEYIKLTQNQFLGYAEISKNTMGIYMFAPEKGKQDAQLQGHSYGANKDNIIRIVSKLVNKYPDQLEVSKNNIIKYIG